jgi:hypothetical protein
MRVQDIAQHIFKARNAVALLFISLLILQILDAHSTLSAGAERHETNGLIIWLANWVGFAAAVVITKAFSILVLFLLYRLWRLTEGAHDGKFVVILTLLAVIYSIIDGSNYFF